MRWNINAWSRQVQENYPDDEVIMVTLTYDTQGTIFEASEYRPGHISEFCRKIKQFRYVNAYCWVAEVTGQGVLHYHVLIVIKRGCKFPYPDDAGLWRYGMSNVKRSRTGVFYIISHSAKEYQKDFSKFPKGARLFGMWDRLGIKNIRAQERMYKEERSKGFTGDYEFAGITDEFGKEVIERMKNHA